MSDIQLKALQRYISAVCNFMLYHTSGGGNIHELLAAKKHLELTFGRQMPERLPDLL